MKENLQSRLEKSLWARELLLLEVKNQQVEDFHPAKCKHQVQQLQHLAINTVVLGVQTLLNLDITTQTSSEEVHMIHTQRHKVLLQALQQQRKSLIKRYKTKRL